MSAALACLLRGDEDWTEGLSAVEAQSARSFVDSLHMIREADQQRRAEEALEGAGEKE